MHCLMRNCVRSSFSSVTGQNTCTCLDGYTKLGSGCYTAMDLTDEDVRHFLKPLFNLLELLNFFVLLRRPFQTTHTKLFEGLSSNLCTFHSSYQEVIEQKLPKNPRKLYQRCRRACKDGCRQVEKASTALMCHFQNRVKLYLFKISRYISPESQLGQLVFSLPMPDLENIRFMVHLCGQHTVILFF